MVKQPPTTSFAILKADDMIVFDIGDQEAIGVAVPSSAWPGAKIICLRPDIVEAARKVIGK